jgi:hypothetical protein
LIGAAGRGILMRFGLQLLIREPEPRNRPRNRRFRFALRFLMLGGPWDDLAAANALAGVFR